VSEEGKKNQGEGDRESDRRYREGARQFVDEGRVAPAAKAASAALDGDEGPVLRDAERAGKARIAEEDPSAGEGPLPSFWTDEQQSRWDRVKDAMHRDWLQTRSDLSMSRGADLGQTAKKTVKQAAGTAPGPTSAEAGVGWDTARHAIRLGHGAATFWASEPAWNHALAARLKDEWEDLDTGIDWVEVRELVRHGWEQGRKDVAPMRDF
jgi:hypothetical protein